MKTADYIHGLKDELISFYSATRAEQKRDDSFYTDTFNVPQIRSLQRLQRTGRAARMIDRPAEHIITSNPQAFRLPKRDTKGAKDDAIAVANECNRWLSILKRGNPNPFKEAVKNKLRRGESWVHPVHNELWVTGPRVQRGLPVLFYLPDPMNIYADPNEDEDGVPREHVLVYYNQKPGIIRQRYPGWEPKTTKDGKDPDTVEWLEYWSVEQIYFEADGVQLQTVENPYKFIPFVHKLSGFGKSSPEGKMEELIVGRLRHVRDLLTRECAIVSDIDSIFHLFANRSIDVQPNDDQHEVPDNFAKDYEFGPGLVHVIPPGLTITRSEEMVPEPQLFQYLYRISAELDAEDPPVLAGSAAGETGRQQDMTYSSAMTRYDTIVENTEYEFSRAFGMALEMCEKIPTLCPTEFGLDKSEIGGNYEVQIVLKADDPIEKDRMATLGSRLYQQGEIDLRTNLTKYQGYTQDDAEEIVTNMLVDRVIFQDPEIAQLIGLKAAEKMGVADEIAAIRMKAQQAEKRSTTLQQNPPPPSEMMQRGGETSTPQGREMIDMALTSKGQRAPPERYFRNA